MSNNNNRSNNNNGGRGNGHFNNWQGRGNARSNNRNYSNNRRNSSTINNPKFEGDCSDLKGYIIDVNMKGDQYNKTWKKIKEYIGKTYTEGGDIRKVLEKKVYDESIDITKPKALKGNAKEDDVEKVI